MDRIHLAQDGGRWGALGNMVMSFGFHTIYGEFLDYLKTS
jgi:hypothetical protein